MIEQAFKVVKEEHRVAVVGPMFVRTWSQSDETIDMAECLAKDLNMAYKLGARSMLSSAGGD